QALRGAPAGHPAERHRVAEPLRRGVFYLGWNLTVRPPCYAHGHQETYVGFEAFLAAAPTGVTQAAAAVIQAVGIVGGEPKCCKSFLALDIAVAVASGAPCLRRFPVARTGRVLLFAAEDALGVVRRRLDGICAAAGVDLAALDLDVITAP